MPVVNIIDRRVYPYRFRKINAVVEATWHDNNCENADQVPSNEGPDYREQKHISIEQAVAWANAFSTPVTLHIYDEGGGIE